MNIELLLLLKKHTDVLVESSKLDPEDHCLLLFSII